MTRRATVDTILWDLSLYDKRYKMDVNNRLESIVMICLKGMEDSLALDTPKVYNSYQQTFGRAFLAYQPENPLDPSKERYLDKFQELTDLARQEWYSGD